MLGAEAWRATCRNALSREESSGKMFLSLHGSPWATVFISTQELSTCFRRRLLGTSACYMLWKIMHTSVLNKLIILHILPHPVVVKIRKDIPPVWGDWQIAVVYPCLLIISRLVERWVSAICLPTVRWNLSRLYQNYHNYSDYPKLHWLVEYNFFSFQF